jgi:hypothetical protein
LVERPSTRHERTVTSTTADWLQFDTVDAKPAEPSPESLEAAYRRANTHRNDFAGLTVDDAVALAAELGLTLEVLPVDGWHTSVMVSGRVTVFERDGVIVPRRG